MLLFPLCILGTGAICGTHDSGPCHPMSSTDRKTAKGVQENRAKTT